MFFQCAYQVMVQDLWRQISGTLPGADGFLQFLTLGVYEIVLIKLDYIFRFWHPGIKLNLARCIVMNWLGSNKLSQNSKKSKVMFFGARAQLDRIKDVTVMNGWRVPHRDSGTI